MSEQDYGRVSGQIQRSRDLYRIHDSSGKQKKQRKDKDEKEFMERLEESEKSVEGYAGESFKELEPAKPRNDMLSQLSNSAPPPVIEEVEDD